MRIYELMVSMDFMCFQISCTGEVVPFLVALRHVVIQCSPERIWTVIRRGNLFREHQFFSGNAGVGIGQDCQSFDPLGIAESDASYSNPIVTCCKKTLVCILHWFWNCMHSPGGWFAVSTKSYRSPEIDMSVSTVWGFTAPPSVEIIVFWCFSIWNDHFIVKFA